MHEKELFVKLVIYKVISL